MALTGTGAIITQSEFNGKTGTSLFSDTNTTNKCVIKSEIINYQPTYFTFNNNSSYADNQAVKASDIEMKKRTVTIVVKDNSSDAASVTKTFRYSGIGTAGFTDRAAFIAANNFTSKTFTSGSKTYTTEVDVNNRLCIDLINTTKYSACVYCEDSQVGIAHLYVTYTAMEYSNTSDTNSTIYSYLNIQLESSTTYVYIYLCKRSELTNSYNLILSCHVDAVDAGLLASEYNKLSINGLKVNSAVISEFEVPLTTSGTSAEGTYTVLSNISFNSGYTVDTSSATATIYYKIRANQVSWSTQTTSLAIGTSPLGSGDKVYTDSSIGYMTNTGCQNKTVNVSCFSDLLKPTLKYITFDKNGKWSSSTQNPNTSQWTAYESSSNVGVANSMALGYIKCQGYNEVTVYIRSNGEANYDYTIIGKANQTLPTTWSSSISSNTTVQAHTKGAQQSSWSLLSYWTAVTYTGLTTDTETKIEIAYGKDSGINNGTDKGYLLIPGGNSSSPENFFAISVIFRFDGLVFSYLKFNHSGSMQVYNQSGTLLFTGTFESPWQWPWSSYNDYFNPQTGTIVYGADAFGLGYWIPYTSLPTEVQLTWTINSVAIGGAGSGSGNGVSNEIYASCTPSSFSRRTLTKAVYPEVVPLRTPTLSDYSQSLEHNSHLWYIVCTIGNGLLI